MKHSHGRRNAVSPQAQRELSDEHGDTSTPVQLDTTGVGTSSMSALMAAGGNQAFVQLSGGDASTDVHGIAAEGVSSGGGSLPHLDAIQRSFGAHDVSSVRAHTGDRAAAATRAMGANAYATGNDVALGPSGGDLHTTAHEAAHVVQQRSGVQLSGGVGAAGDRHEQHADAVADRVVAGRSAADLLNQYGGAGSRAETVQQKAVQLDEESGQQTTDTNAPTVTTGDQTSFELTLAIPIGGPVRLEGTFGGTYTQENGTDGPKTEVEGMLYAGILVDLVLIKLRAGIEGRVKFTADGHQGVMDAIRDGIHEIAQWKIAQEFAPRLRSARQTLRFAWGAQVQGFAHHTGRLIQACRNGNWEAETRTNRLLGLGLPTARESAMYFADGWNRNLDGRFEGLGVEINQDELIDVDALEALFIRVGEADTADAAVEAGQAANQFGIAELARTLTSAETALDGIEIVENNPSIGFEASVAFRAGVSVRAGSNTSAELQYADVTTIRDEEGQAAWYTSAQQSTIVTGRLQIGQMAVQLVGDFKPEEVELTGKFSGTVSTAPPEVAENSVRSVMSAVRGGSSAFQMLSSPLATTRQVINQVGSLVQESASELTDPSAISSRRLGRSSQSQGAGVEVKLKFQRSDFTLTGGSVKVTLTVARLDAEEGLGATASVGVSGHIAREATFAASW